MQSLSKDFLEYLYHKSENISDDVLEKAKDCLCDYLGVTEAGAIQNIDRWCNLCKYIPSGKVPVIGMNIMTDGKTACLINGYNAHSLELDDGHRFAMIHLGAAIISALYSAEKEGKVTRDKFLVGIIMGYEAACRISLAIQPSHKEKGFHTAGTCGTIGAAIGVAFALDMNIQQMQTVLATAVGSAAGMLELQEQGSELKPYNLGRAAMDGFSAAYMGYTCFNVPDDIIGGDRGFLNLFCDEGNSKKLVAYQEYFEIERIYVKPYAACRHCHSAIEAALCLRKDIVANEIKEIVIETYALAMRGHDHTEIKGVSSAKLSMPYSVAVAIVLGRADVDAFSINNITRSDILELVRRIRVVENLEFTSESSEKRISKVEVRMYNDTIWTHQIDYAKGDPENPMNRKEIKNKVLELIGNKKAEQIFNDVFL